MSATDAPMMSAIEMQAHLLRSIRSELDRVIRPELNSAEAKNAAQLASELLAFLTVGHHELPRFAATRRQQLAALLQSSNGAHGAPPSQPPPPASEFSGDREFDRTFTALTRQLATAPGKERELSANARAALELEHLWQFDDWRTIAAEIRANQDPVAQVETELTAARVQDYLRSAVPGFSGGVVRDLERVAGGYSKDTFRMRVAPELWGCEQLVLRRDLPFGPGENTVLEEFELLICLANAGLPVPRPLWREADPQLAGRPFLIFPQYPGVAVLGDWLAGTEERRTVCLEVARCMARLHALPAHDIAPLAAGPDQSPQKVVRDYVRHWRDKWHRRRVHPSIILECAFDWLEHNAPAQVPRLSLIHGDISFRNTLIHEGHLVVLLDWEFAHLGDPMEDLSYFRLVAEPLVPWKDVMRAYCDAGGEPYDAQRAAYYAVWRSVRNSTTTTTAWHGFLTGKYPALKAAYQGVALYRLFLRDVAERLSEALR